LIKIDQKGYEFVKKNYNWTKLVKDFKKKMIDVIKEILDENRKEEE